jgi:hypothetical protein
MVSLQVRAYREHKHVSFLLLSIATTCALLYIVAGQILGFLRDTILAPPLWVFACATALLFVQMIVGCGVPYLVQIVRAIGVPNYKR